MNETLRAVAQVYVCALHKMWCRCPSSKFFQPDGQFYKLDIPVMFTRVSSEEFMSLTVLGDSAPSSEFLHRLAHD